MLETTTANNGYNKIPSLAATFSISPIMKMYSKS